MAYCDFLAGVFGGVCNLFISHPLDTIKTNMQSSNLKFTNAAMIVIKAEGIKGYYRGLLFPLCSNGLLNSIIFGVYGNSFRYFQNLAKDDVEKQKLWYTHIFMAGCCGGLLKSVVACPIELAKVRLQVRVNNVRSPFMALRDLIKSDGPQGLFRGLTPMLWRDIAPYGIFMLVYEYALEKLRNPAVAQSMNKSHFREENVNPLHSAIAGSIAGVISWAPVLQFDVVKTRMMTETDPKRFRNLWHCFSVIIAESGYKALFRGGSVLILRAIPLCATTFVGYEYMLRYCQSLQPPH